MKTLDQIIREMKTREESKISEIKDAIKTLEPKRLTNIPKSYIRVRYDELDKFGVDLSIVDKEFFEYPQIKKLTKKNECAESYQFWKINGKNYKITI